MKSIFKVILACCIVLCSITPFATATAADGDFLWKASIDYTWSSPVVIDTKVYMQDQDANITCYNTSNGSIVWTKSLSTGEYPTSSPIYRNGKLYAMAGSSLYKINPTDGATENTFIADGLISCQAPAVSASTIYIATSTTLYAVKADTFQELWKKSIGNANVIIGTNVLYVFANKFYALTQLSGLKITRKLSFS